MPERTFTTRTLRVVLDLAPQVLAIDARDADLCDDTVPTAVPTNRGLVSAALLMHKVKQVDDGVRAAVELLTQRGAGRMSGRRLLLAVLADRLTRAQPPARGDAVEVVYAACRLGGIEARVPRAVERLVAARVAAHLADERRAMPMGFYAWSPELTRAWNQDRMLQTPLEDRASIGAVAEALAGDLKLRAMYQDHNVLARRLAGRRVRNDLRPVVAALVERSRRPAPKRPAFLPASGSHEQRLVRTLAGDTEADVLGLLLRGVKSGAIDLTPPKQPSWKDLQVWSLEALARPERTPEVSKLRMGHEYREHLDRLFKAAFALIRETHIKEEVEEEESEEGGLDEEGERLVVLNPSLTVEPLATHYARTAEALRFVHELLDDHLGHALDTTARECPWAKPARSLREELTDTESLLRGANETARRELGFEPDPRASRHVDRFTAWGLARGQDTDLGADARMMVPVSYDPETKLTRVWAFLGWATEPLAVRFAKPPQARAERLAPAGTPAPNVRFYFDEQQSLLDTPVIVEARAKRRLDRDEFRRLCDRHRTVRAIVRALHDAP